MTATRAIRVTFQDDWTQREHRGLLDLDPRVRTLCRVLVSYPEVRYILPDRVTNLADGEGFPEADPDAMEMTDLDNDDAQALADRDTSDRDR